MTASEIIAKARAKGYSVRLEGVSLRVIPKPDAELRALPVEHKSEIVALLEAERQAKVAVSDAIRPSSDESRPEPLKPPVAPPEPPEHLDADKCYIPRQRRRGRGR